MIKNIEDLLVWQKARELNKEIYSLTVVFPVHEKTNLVSQSRRASSSICANIAEGFGRFNYRESIQFYRTARGSLSELRSHLYLAMDQEFIEKEKFNKLLLFIDEIGKMLNGLINSTKDFRTKFLKKT